MKWLSVASGLLLVARLEAAVCEPQLRPLRPPVALEGEGPQAIAVDETDGSLWVTFALSVDVLHLSAELEVIGRYRAPFESVSALGEGITGIAYNSVDDTLFLVRPRAFEIVEVEKHGLAEDPQVLAPTGRVIALSLEPPPNIVPEPFPKGIAFDSNGNGGAGSIWLVEAVMTRVYELSLDDSAQVLHALCHPDDPDGCPGGGRAAQGGAVGLYRSDGDVVGLEITGGMTKRDRIHRVDLDLERTGLTYPLDIVGGRPSGFARSTWLDVPSGKYRDILYVLVESSAELHVLEVSDPDILPVTEFRSERSDRGVELSWKARDSYDLVTVRRGGELLAHPDPTQTSYTDVAAPPGVLDYELTVAKGDCELSFVSRIVVGPGEVLRSALVPDGDLVDWTEDSVGFLWGAFADNWIGVYDKELNELVRFPGPFGGEDDMTSGIAYNPTGVEDTIFVYNSATQEVAEINDSGELVGPVFPSGLSDGALVASMLYNPAGDGGAGSFWYADAASGTVEERSRDGRRLRSCRHPDFDPEDVPPDVGTVCGREPGAFITTYLWGISAVPGSEFRLLEMAGGDPRAPEAEEILVVDVDTCEAVGASVPIDAIARVRPAWYLGLHRTEHDGKPVLYVSSQLPYVLTSLIEVDASARAVPAVGRLRCAQLGAERDVTVSFVADSSLDAVEVLRDGSLAGVADPGATPFVDVDVPTGFHEYEVRGVRGGDRGDSRRCALQVGKGSIAKRRFSAPVSLLHELGRDPLTGGHVAASTSKKFSACLHMFDRDLRLDGEIPSPFLPPYEVAALAVRVVDGAREMYCLGWRPGAQPGTTSELPVEVIDSTGAGLRSFVLPIPPKERPYLVFPNGMCWDEATDTFWYVERNAAGVVNFAPDGTVLAWFPHPAPPHQDGVYAYGAAVDGARGTLYLTSADPLDHSVTRIVESTLHGTLTGWEIPVGSRRYDRVRGFDWSADRLDFVVSATTGSISDLVRYRAFDPLAPVTGLTCQRDGSEILLTWKNGASYDTVTIFRGAEAAAVITDGAELWRDPSPGDEGSFYRVVGGAGDLEAPGVVCHPAGARMFIRGEVDEEGDMDLTDVIRILDYLYTGGDPLPCPDAADVDDSGELDLTDPIAILMYLFLSGAPPADPFPLPGYDPTGDTLDCP